MLSIEKCTVLPTSLLASYSENGYADSYRTELSGHISLEEFVFGFYTTALFKLERFILTWTVLKPSNDLQAKELMDGKADKFAAWTIEARKENELLMCDMLRRTRSWFMVNHIGTKENSKTQYILAQELHQQQEVKQEIHRLDYSLSSCSRFIKCIRFSFYFLRSVNYLE